MKKFEYRFNYKEPVRQIILNNMDLCSERDEDKILPLLLQGVPGEQIAIETGYSYRTICRRKKDLYEKIKDFLSA